MTEEVEASVDGHVHLGDKMQALVYEAPRRMNMQTLDTPVPGPHDAVIAVEYSGICGSELSGFVGESSIVNKTN
jgi:threonine dehydrogenase-like Zn-dependent dehydrogenase